MATPVTTPPPKKKANMSLIILLSVIVLAAVGYYVYTTYYQPVPTTDDQTTGAPELPVSATDWDKEVFQNPAYTSLQNPIPLPLTSGPKGNPNPFLEGKPSETP